MYRNTDIKLIIWDLYIFQYLYRNVTTYFKKKKKRKMWNSVSMTFLIETIIPVVFLYFKVLKIIMLLIIFETVVCTYRKLYPVPRNFFDVFFKYHRFGDVIRKTRRKIFVEQGIVPCSYPLKVQERCSGHITELSGLSD